MHIQLKYYLLSFSLLASSLLMAQRTTITDFSIAYNLGAYNRAAALGEELLLRKSIQNNPDAWYNLSTKLGIAYHHLGNYNRGLERLDYVIVMAKEMPKFPANALLLAYNEKGKILKELGRLTEAQAVYHQAINFFKSRRSLSADQEAQVVYLNALMGAGLTAYTRNDNDNAKMYIETALQYSIKINSKDAALSAQKHLYLGRIEDRLGNNELAQKHINKAIELSQNASTDQENLNWGIFFKELAGYFLAHQELEKALNYNHAAFKNILPEWASNASSELPELERLHESSSLSLAAQTLAQHADILYQDPAKLKATLDAYYLLDKFVTRLRQLYIGESARLLWSNRALNYYEQAINTCLALAEKTNDNSYKKEAFKLSERSKSLLLLEAFKKIKAKKITAVPEAVITKEEELEKRVDELQNEVDLLKKRRKATEEYKTKLRQLERTLLEEKRVYEDFLVQIQKQHPDYYKLKYDLTVVEVDAIQKRLNDEQMMIEYFIGDKELISFKITQDEFEVFKTPLSYDLTKTIDQCREGIYGYYLNETSRNAQIKARYIEQYKTTSQQLYQTLLKPILEHGNTKRRLMIILAGNLGFLPFEALLTDKVDGNNFKDYPYLVKDYAVGYCYSATLLHEMQIKEHIPKKIFLGFAPEFDSEVKLGGRYSFNPLEHSQQEVIDVHELIGTGNIFTGAQATKENFQENCEGYCILHIATHGFMNSNDSKNSFLAFSSSADSSSNELLYVRDLYNMHLTASMVVLSACETGLGELYESEGIASLARGFAYAGAKSIITSLWAVNDYTTAEIMKFMYKHIQAGMNKDEALFEAKNEFLKAAANDQVAHPFLWSAFIMIGDESPRPGTKKNMSSTSSSTPFMIGLGALLLLILGGLFLKRRAA